jgi:hypothetical protein
MMRPCRIALLYVALVGTVVFVTAEVTALNSSTIDIPQPARVWALSLLILTLGTAVVMWTGERFDRLEGLITTYAVNSIRSPRADDTNPGGIRRERDAKVLDLFKE